VSNDGGHCVLVFNVNGKWHVNDYTTVYTGHNSLKEAVEEYNEQYLNRYVKKEDGVIVYNGFISYDYKKGKFSSVKHTLKKLLK
jgi:glucan phosphorylase